MNDYRFGSMSVRVLDGGIQLARHVNEHVELTLELGHQELVFIKQIFPSLLKETKPTTTNGAQ